MTTKTKNALRQHKTCVFEVHVTAHILAALNIVDTQAFDATNVVFQIFEVGGLAILLERTAEFDER
jgi:hypothetical protein